MTPLAMIGNIYCVDAGELDTRLREFSYEGAPSSDVAMIFWPYSWGQEKIDVLRKVSQSFYHTVCGSPTQDLQLEVDQFGFAESTKTYPTPFGEMNWFAPEPWQQLLINTQKSALTKVVVAGPGRGLEWEIAMLQTFGWQGTSIYVFPKDMADRTARISMLIDLARIYREKDRWLFYLMLEMLQAADTDEHEFTLDRIHLTDDYSDSSRYNKIQSLAIQASLDGKMPKRTVDVIKRVGQIDEGVEAKIRSAIDSLVAAVHVSGHLLLVTGEMPKSVFRHLMWLSKACTANDNFFECLNFEILLRGCGIAWILKHLEGSISDHHIVWYLVHSLWNQDSKSVLRDGNEELPYEKGHWRQLDALVPRLSVSFGDYLEQHEPGSLRRVNSFLRNLKVGHFVEPDAGGRAHTAHAIDYLERRIALTNRETGELSDSQQYLFSALREFLSARGLV
jgi:hypothetical protein